MPEGYPQEQGKQNDTRHVSGPDKPRPVIVGKTEKLGQQTESDRWIKGPWPKRRGKTLEQ
jgi:hypothetical protein